MIPNINSSENIGDNQERRFISNKSQDYNNWMRNILPILSKDKLNVIVSHGKYIRNNVLKNCLEYLNRQGKISKRGKRYIFNDSNEEETQIKRLWEQLMNSRSTKFKNTENLTAFLVKYELANDESERDTIQKLIHVSELNQKDLNQITQTDMSVITTNISELYNQLKFDTTNIGLNNLTNCDYKYHLDIQPNCP